MIILSVASSSQITDLLNAVDAAVNAGATVVSMSWGAMEFSGMSYYDGHFNRANVSFTASSGDGGAGVEWPAVSPYVLAVGGTSLYLDANGNRTSETGWSGSGGGPSAYYSIPSYQKGWENSGARGVSGMKFVADAAAPYYFAPGVGSPVANTIVAALAGTTKQPGPVPANFTANPTSGQSPLTVQFSDQSSGSVASWSWNFGDGATSTAQNPSHTYNSSGNFTAVLTVTGSNGQTSSASQAITVTNAPPSANGVFSISASPSSITVKAAPKR